MDIALYKIWHKLSGEAAGFCYEPAMQLKAELLENFEEGDCFLTLIYSCACEPKTVVEAERNAEEFLKKLQAAFEKEKRELRFIRKPVDWPKCGFIHHHMVISRFDLNAIRSMWPHGTGYKKWLEPEEADLLVWELTH